MSSRVLFSAPNLSLSFTRVPQFRADDICKRTDYNAFAEKSYRSGGEELERGSSADELVFGNNVNVTVWFTREVKKTVLSSNFKDCGSGPGPGAERKEE